jgi:hypothetical protein
LIGIETEVVKRAVANRIRVLISCKRFRVPCDKVWICSVNIPRRAAISGVSYRPIMRKAGMLRRRMKLDVSNIDSSSYWHGEKLNSAIQVLVIKRVLIVPDAGRRVGDFVTQEPDTIVSVIRFDLIYRRAGPSLNGWLLSEGRAHRTKTERLVDSGYTILTVRSVVIHVALPRMSLAPSVFMWGNVLRLGKIRRPGV